MTLLPGTAPATLLPLIDTTAPGACVKDSFADVELTAAGFHVLFEAHWIHRPPGPPTAAPDLAWEVADTPEALRAWALAWADGNDGDDDQADIFRPALLDDPSISVLAGRSADGHVVAGAVASHGAPVPGIPDVLGISNVFARDDGPDAAWPVVLDAAHRLFPGVPLVGYEHGDELENALRHGFGPIGPLRIWLHGGSEDNEGRDG